MVVLQPAKIDAKFAALINQEAQGSRRIRIESVKHTEYKPDLGRQKLMLLKFSFLPRIDELNQLESQLSNYAPFTDGIVQYYNYDIANFLFLVF